MSCCSRPEKEKKESHSHSHHSCCSSHHGHSHHHEEEEHCHETKKATSIHRQMTIEEILGMFPNKAQKLSHEITNAGLHCVGCHAATWETLEVGMKSHGKTEAEIDELVRRLNKLLQEPAGDAEGITVTPRGVSKFLEFAAQVNKQGWALRFGEEAGGCGGMEYILDFSEKAAPTDEVFVSNGLEIHINKKQLQRLRGCEIDYVDGLMGAGFKISNPNVKSSCGCGTSHGY